MKRLIHNVQSPVASRSYVWEYYTDEYYTMAFPSNFDARAAAYVHVYLAKLMQILARVSEVLYGLSCPSIANRSLILYSYSGVPDISSDIHAFVKQADIDFQEWLDSLPTSLRVDYSSTSTIIHLPAVLELQ